MNTIYAKKLLNVSFIGMAVALSGCSNSSDNPVGSTPTDPIEPVFDPALFDDQSARVNNRFFPLKSGTTSILEGYNEDGEIETVVTNVSHETRMVNNIESTIVVDREYEDGELVEETFDWYAQDSAGNVWYLGEASTEYEDGVAVSTDGSWESGLDLENTGQIATAGIIMKADPVVGDKYKHEIYPGLAEDEAEIYDLAASFVYLDGRTVTALQIREINPLDPESSAEFKYYADGSGLIAEVNTDGTEQVELVEFLDQANPVITAANFSRSLTIDHRWLPLVVGTVRHYEVETDEGLETITIEVLNETRDVMGVTARVVRDQVFLDGVIIEDTRDWFAQDNDGNVWYFGEAVDNYEYDEQGVLIEINNDSAWEAGVSGAQPGIIMPADPRVGDSYRQEYSPGEAEDKGAVVGMNIEVILRDGSVHSTLKTRDWNPLEPEAGNEYKYYAEGFGLVREEDEDGEEVVDLVSSL